MVGFAEREVMKELVSQLNSRGSRYEWNTFSGAAAGRLEVGILRTTQSGREQLISVTMNDAGRWVLYVTFNDTPLDDFNVDLKLQLGSSASKVAEQVLKVVVASDVDAPEEQVIGAPGPSFDLDSMPPKASSWTIPATKTFSLWAVVAAVPSIAAFPIDFRFVVGGYLGLAGLIASLVVWLRVDWTRRSGQWLAVASTILGSFMVLGHLSYLWNVLT